METPEREPWTLRLKNKLREIFERQRLLRFAEIGGRTLWVLGVIAVVSLILGWITEGLIDQLPQLKKSGNGYAVVLTLAGSLFAIFWMHFNDLWRDYDLLRDKIGRGEWRGPTVKDARSLIMALVCLVVIAHVLVMLVRADDADIEDPSGELRPVEAHMNLPRPIALSPPVPLVSVPILFGQASGCDPECEEGVTLEGGQRDYLRALATALAACSADGERGQVEVSIYGFSDTRRFAQDNEIKNLRAANGRRAAVNTVIRSAFSQWPERLDVRGPDDGEWASFEAMAANQPATDRNGGPSGQLNRSAVVTVWKAGNCSPAGLYAPPAPTEVESLRYVAYLEDRAVEATPETALVTTSSPPNSEVELKSSTVALTDG